MPVLDSKIEPLANAEDLIFRQLAPNADGNSRAPYRNPSRQR